jgi:glucose-1-phosphate cytidylyltransferase
MKIVILAGGLGTRLSEETVLKPKPMVEVGGMPILWHIMKTYSSHGFNDFIICLGYKGYLVKEYFVNYFLHKSDVTINLSTNAIEFHDSQVEPWKITLVDTGNNTMTGGRIKRIQKHINGEPFMLTYGDGLGNIDINELLIFHKNSGKKCTVTAVQPSGRFGSLSIDSNNSVKSFLEKPKGDGAWINGGYFVCESSIFDYIEDDNTIWEKAPMEHLALAGQMNAFKHIGFWKPMDTLKDKMDLHDMWVAGNAPWKTW